mmetsp:Transcript_21739/g.39216  ORF Transcript_21739/g.39216 Transcript_21739/m.39216 type:complete len:90 (+) Transcript_21739:1643-1912(+)
MMIEATMDDEVEAATAITVDIEAMHHLTEETPPSNPTNPTPGDPSDTTSTTRDTACTIPTFDSSNSAQIGRGESFAKSVPSASWKIVRA